MRTDDTDSKHVKKKLFDKEEECAIPPIYDIEEVEDKEEEDSKGELIDAIDPIPSLGKLVVKFLRKFFIILLPLRG